MRPTQDLRRVFSVARAFSTAGGEGPDELGDPSSPADPDDEDDTEDDTDDTDDAKAVRDPKLQKLSRESARYRTEAKAERERADAAEARVQTLLSQRMEDRFFVSAAGKVTDIEAAWKLADKASITMQDDGTIVGTDEAVAAVIERYPALVTGAADDTDDEGDFVPDAFGSGFGTGGLPHSGRPNGKKPDNKSTSDAILAKKYPALAVKRGK